MGLTPETAAMLSISNSLCSYALDVNGRLAAMWGYGVRHMFDLSVCYAWMLTTPVCFEKPIWFMRISQAVVRELLDQYENVEVNVDSRYIQATNWLRWLGFTEVGMGPVDGFVIMRKGR